MWTFGFSNCWQIFLVSQCYQAECVQNWFQFQFETCRVLKQQLFKFTMYFRISRDTITYYIIIFVWQQETFVSFIHSFYCPSSTFMVIGVAGNSCSNFQSLHIQLLRTILFLSIVIFIKLFHVEIQKMSTVWPRPMWKVGAKY